MAAANTRKKNKEKKARKPVSWEEIRAHRATVNISEFCELVGWHRSRFHRHRDHIKTIEGYGNLMIPVAEVERILGGTEVAV